MYLSTANKYNMRFTELEEGVNDPHIFKAVFMAGAPGSGKSTVASKLFSHTGLKSLNVDNFWTLYNKLGKQGDYEKYWELFQKQEKTLLGGRLGLLIDGTARNPEKMGQVKARLEEMGYDTAMVFVNTSLDVSMSRVQARAEQTGRHVDPAFVQDTWEQVQRGLGKLQGMFGRQFFIVDNNRSPDLTYAAKSFHKWLNVPPSMPAAKEWIQAHRPGNQNANQDVN